MRLCSASPIRPLKFACLGLLLAAWLAANTFCRAQSPPMPLLPNGVAYDAAGNLYFADTNRHQVYESSLAGVLTVVVGNGTQGFSGDGGAATTAQLDSPEGIAIGPDGTLYIADTGNQRVRSVVAGRITTFAGNGSAGFSGDGGSALQASFRNPGALAIDSSGALLVCDAGNHRVRRISNSTITTIIGNGTQGFAGDGGAAAAAELDTPAGVAVGTDGRIYIADSHNDRIRVVSTDGTISTFAGIGLRGYTGDGGLAAAAELALPRGLVAAPDGTLLFADSNNHRVRQIDTSGSMSTVAGNGIQGDSADGSPAVTALNSPRGIAVSTFSSPVFADVGNRLVREATGNGNLYLPAGLAPGRASTVALSAAATQTYGSENTTVSVTGPAGTPRGVVVLLDDSSAMTVGALDAGSASFSSTALGAGQHSLSASFPGDGVNPAGTSVSATVMVDAATATATANGATIEYGEVLPVLTGSLSGILPQDSGDVTAVFSSTASALSAPGTYPIGATLSGTASSNYSVALGSASGSLQIDQAPSLTVEQPLAQGSYAGLPLVITADVASTTQGTPTGTVNFTEGNAVVATASLAGGVASGTYLSPSSGTHSITAAYLGDTDFKPSVSQATTTTVGALPDFTISASNGASQTIGSGGIATYTLILSAQPAPFTGVVDLSASGLPEGAVAIFSPSQTVPGAGSATVTVSIQTAASGALSLSVRDENAFALCLLLPLSFAFCRRRRNVASMSLCILSLAWIGVAGCGARSISTALVAHQVYSLQVTGTATNLAGAVVTHSVPLTLIVE